MNTLKRHIKVFSQFSLKEKFGLFTALCAERIAGQVRESRPLIESKRFFDALVLNGMQVRKVSSALNSVMSSTVGGTGSLRVVLRRISSDLSVFHQVFIGKEYQPVVDLIAKRLPSESVRTIVDAGAYIGFTSIFFHNAFPGARIIAIEPNAENFTLLEQNIALNAHVNTQLIRAGLWSTDSRLSEAEKFRDGRAWAYSLMPESPEKGNGIAGISLETVMTKYDIDLIDILKMDIEGAERFIFRDEGSVSRILSRVRAIAMEIHDEYRSRESIEDALRRNSFTLFDSGESTIGYNTRFR